MDNLVLFLLCNLVCTMRHARGPALLRLDVPLIAAQQGRTHEQPALSSGPCPHSLPACMQAEPHIAAARIIRSASRVSLTLPESMGLRMALLLTWRTLHRLGQRHSQVCTIRCCSLVQSNFSLLSGCEPEITAALLLPVSGGNPCTYQTGASSSMCRLCLCCKAALYPAHKWLPELLHTRGRSMYLDRVAQSGIGKGGRGDTKAHFDTTSH